ncbi:MAG: gluconate 2-dehydrogenase subunit 3 family protein [Bryobacterales bacterium]|nr:gluconate 2-dehydrogenase subunit 3 family protein [Bryobacterales bacterium]
MKRRSFFQGAAVLPALPAAAQYGGAGAVASELPKLSETAPEAAADGVRTFFTSEQLATLRRLAELLVPALKERPGAVDCGAVEFLDFLLKASPAARQTLYRNGLDRLQAESQRLHKKAFAQLDAPAAGPILAPLRKPWTSAPPADPFARFLREAQDDLLQATVNSREFAQAMSRRSRSASGVNAYWLPLD